MKQLDMIGVQGNREFLAEVLTIGRVHHPNLINLVGYCVNGHQRLLVYEYMKNGSLEEHLFGKVYCYNEYRPGKQNTSFQVCNLIYCII